MRRWHTHWRLSVGDWSSPLPPPPPPPTVLYSIESTTFCLLLLFRALAPKRIAREQTTASAAVTRLTRMLRLLQIFLSLSWTPGAMRGMLDGKKCTICASTAHCTVHCCQQGRLVCLFDSQNKRLSLQGADEAIQYKQTAAASPYSYATTERKNHSGRW